MIKVSLIIPTFERPGILRSLLEQIVAHPFHEIGKNELELLIIDQSQKPDEALRTTVLPYPTRYYHLLESGLPNARNTGILAARGDICIFIDDDVEIDADLVRAHWRQYDDHSVGAVAGRIVEYGNRKRVTGRTPATMYGINILGRPHPNTGGTTDRDVLSFRGCNFSVRRSLIYTVGMFDTRFRPPFLLEESDYAYRIRTAGFRIRFSPEATVVHLEHKSGGCRIEDPMRYQSARFHNAVLFFLKNMSPASLPVFLSASLAIGLMKALHHPPVLDSGLQLLAGMKEGFTSFRQRTPSSLEDYLGHQPAPLWESSLSKNDKVD